MKVTVTLDVSSEDRATIARYYGKHGRADDTLVRSFIRSAYSGAMLDLDGSSGTDDHQGD